ncbi:MAG: NAD-dependent isocitrate dehydrogenase [Candidatus Marinimicrobia bacterium]|nr:NAD-dependent isocitrate dehydrogenase [Candidatus Neomarinimicrobiota bacterium]
MSRAVTIIPGDWVGPEIAREVVKIVDASGAKIDWDWQDSGEIAIKNHGTPLPQELLDSVERNRLALKGIIDIPLGAPYEPPVVALRKIFDLYANLRPCRNFPGIPSRYSDIDILVIRENTQGEYSGIEHNVSPDIVEMMKVVTEDASRRIARFAFEYAKENGRKKITTAHKANIMKLSDGLFLRIACETAEEYPEIEHETQIIDACCMNLVMNPNNFDVLLMGNLYGDIVSDLITGMVGGISGVYGVNIGDDIRVFESMHGKAPEKVRSNEASPLPLLTSAIAMLEYINEKEASERISAAVSKNLLAGLKPANLGGDLSLSDFTNLIIESFES